MAFENKGLTVPGDIMRAVQVDAYGGFEQFKLNMDVEVPSPAENQVLIKVCAAGVNPTDSYIVFGLYDKRRKPALPYTPGTNAAGVIEEVGSEVKGFKKGDRVYTACTQSGAYAEYATAESVYVNHLNEKFSFTDGACIGVPYYTAAKALLIRARAKEGETIVIHGASGAVGEAAVQISKALGLSVVGTAGTEEGMEIVKEMGADFVVNHKEEGYAQAIKDVVEAADIILEVLADVNLEKDIELIKLHGRILVVGSGGYMEWEPFCTVTKECSIMGVNIMETTPREWDQMHRLLREGQECGWLQPRVAKTYLLEDAAAAHLDVIYSPRVDGKFILDTTIRL